jgi:hypothetical protein
MKPSFVQSHQTARLVRLFKGMSLNKPMSFADASAEVGFAVTSTMPAYQSGRRVAEREGVVIDAVRGFGFVRLTGDQISETGERDMLSIWRRARRGSKRQEIAIASNLDQKHMLRSSELLGRLRIIADTASPIHTNRATVPDPEQAPLVDNRTLLTAARK